jgi:transposase
MKTMSIGEVFKMRFIDAYGQYEKGRLTCEEAAEILGISISTFYRKRQIYEEDGDSCVFDQRMGRISPNKAADSEVEFITRLFADRYRDFSVKHFYDFAKREHNVSRSYNWVKNKLTETGLVEKSSRGGKHRLRRERKPMVGMMIHQDGSKHRWIPALDYDLDLIVTLDDASSKITSCFLVEEEGTFSSFQGVYETIKQEGVFCSFYTDRGSHYFYTPEVGGKVDKSIVTQVGRALRQLGIRHIPAYSPQARGRSERMFGTLQNRLPKELALHNITTLEGANRYIKEIYTPRHNEQFCVKPASVERAFIPWVSATVALEDVLCLEESRTVQHDNTVRYNGLILQIPKNEYRHHYIKAEVKVHEYCDHQLAIFYGPLCIGRYDAEGVLINNSNTEVKEADEVMQNNDALNKGHIISNKANYLGGFMYAVV